MTGQQPINRPWSEYPVGTKANANMGGYWLKMESGRWQWNGKRGSFPTPGGDAMSVTLPEPPK